jgi:dUTP pyrophosphatase
MSVITQEIIDLVANIGNIYRLTKTMKKLIPIEKINPNAELPEYATPGSAGMDLRANIPHCNNIGAVWINPGERELIKTGIKIALPEGYFAEVRPRSGLALKHGITVLNSPGTIDSDYRGEICVLLINHSNTPFLVEDGMRIAQLLLMRYESARWHECETGTLDKTERNEGGFGSTGK